MFLDVSELAFANQGGEVSVTCEDGLLGWDSATVGGLSACVRLA